MKKLSTVVFLVLYIGFLGLTSVYAADTTGDKTIVGQKITTLQATDSGLPGGVTEQKGSVGTILSKVFDATGQIGNVYLKAIGTITSGYVPRWNGTSLINGQIRDDGTNVGIGGAQVTGVKLNVTGPIRTTTDIRSNSYCDAAGATCFTPSEIDVSGGVIGGTGTANYITKFTGGTTIANSSIQDTGTSIITSTPITANGILNAEAGITANGNGIIAGNGGSISTFGANTSTYGAFSVKNSAGTRGAYFGFGNGGNTVDLTLDNANNLNISGGNVNVTGGNLDILGQVNGGFGANTTSGTMDWNHISNARSGNGNTLLLGTATNGPGGSAYYHPFSFEYSNKNGAGNMTQFAIPYNSSGQNVGMFMRTRYAGTWQPWSKFLSENTSGNVTVSGTVTASTPTAASHLATKAYVDSAASGAGDNLGNHTATTNLNMSNFDISLPSYINMRAGNGYGLRFWNNDIYKVSMGNGAEYAYGPVTDYSIKTQMNNQANRGFTWGATGLAPTAALSTSGNMEIAGTMTAATPTAATHLTTKAYVDAAITSSVGAASIDSLSDGASDDNSVFLGIESGGNDDGGNNNTGVGRRALWQVTSGVHNSAFGFNALYYNTTGSHNTAVGRSSLQSNVDGVYNTAIGRYSQLNTTSGSNNTSLGALSLDGNTTGYQNTAVGRSALGANTTGYNNVGIGMYAMDANTTGFGNVSLGYDSLGSVTSGDYNVAIGDNAGDALTTGNRNIMIGSNVSAPNTTGSDQINIGDTIYGDRATDRIGIGTTSPDQSLQIVGNVMIGETDTTGGQLLMYGSTAGAYSRAYTTNGNLHIDAGLGSSVGNGIYLNYYTAGNVTMGSTTNESDLIVNGEINQVGKTTNAYGITGRTASTGHGGVIGYSENATAYGILGHANTYGVYAQSASNQGIYGRTLSASHGGVFGYNHDATAYGILGYGADIGVQSNKKIVMGREGLKGTYSSTQVQGIWSIGNGYDVDTSATNDFGNQFGMVYAHTNAGTAAYGGKKPIAGQGHQILFVSAGTTEAMISLTNGNAQFNQVKATCIGNCF